jgi:plastocyanin
MTRNGRILIVLATALGALLIPGTASAGGGCHEPMSQDDTPADMVDTVVLAQACFAPSLLHVDPGATVTFLNEDTFAHNISATGWGHYEDLLSGERFTQTFHDDGIYPFSCTLHPGMNGAIVVGEETDAPAEAAAPVIPASTPPSSTTSGDWAIPAAAGLVLGAGGVAAFQMARRRKPQPALV